MRVGETFCMREVVVLNWELRVENWEWWKGNENLNFDHAIPIQTRSLSHRERGRVRAFPSPRLRGEGRVRGAWGNVTHCLNLDPAGAPVVHRWIKRIIWITLSNIDEIIAYWLLPKSGNNLHGHCEAPDEVRQRSNLFSLYPRNTYYIGLWREDCFASPLRGSLAMTLPGKFFEIFNCSLYYAFVSKSRWIQLN